MQKKQILMVWRQDFISVPLLPVFRNRDITDIDEFNKYLNGSLKDLYEPRLLPDMEKAISILKEKIAAGVRIRIVGDYDIDGVCSTCILYKGLSRVGASVDYVIPERIKDGYGINEHIIEKAAADGIHMILTCDNGIAAIDQIAEAKELGMTQVQVSRLEKKILLCLRKNLGSCDS